MLPNNKEIREEERERIIKIIQEVIGFHKEYPYFSLSGLEIDLIFAIRSNRRKC